MTEVLKEDLYVRVSKDYCLDGSEGLTCGRKESEHPSLGCYGKHYFITGATEFIKLSEFERRQKVAEDLKKTGVFAITKEYYEERFRSNSNPGRFDSDGNEWWACDPYPTWYRWENGELITSRGSDWAEHYGWAWDYS